MAVNAVVAAEMIYLVNSRFTLASVISLDGLTGNRYVLLGIAACISLQIAYTHAPNMQAIFNSTDLTQLEWCKVVAAGLLVFSVAEFEKFVIRHSPLAARLNK